MNRTEQNEQEFFPTPEPLAKYLVDRLMWQVPSSSKIENVLEPSAGTGSFVRALAEHFPDATISGVDPNQTTPKNLPSNVEWEQMSLEALCEALEGETPFDLAAGNPPFSLAEAHLRILHKIVRTGGHIGFLLRGGFLSSKSRAPFFAAYPPKHVYIFGERPSFAWSYTCKTCNFKWFTDPGRTSSTCEDCGSTDLQHCKTDRYDYIFAVWEVGMSPERVTTMTWLGYEANVDA